MRSNYNETENIPNFLKEFMGKSINGLGSKTMYPNVKIGGIYYGNFISFKQKEYTTVKIKELFVIENYRKGFENATIIAECDTPSEKGIYMSLINNPHFYNDEFSFRYDMENNIHEHCIEKKPIESIFTMLYRLCVENVEGGIADNRRFRSYYWHYGKPNETEFAPGPKYVWIDNDGEHVIFASDDEDIYYNSRKECIDDNMKIDHFPSEAEEEPQEMEFTIPVRVTAHDLNEARKKLKRIKSISVL